MHRTILSLVLPVGILFLLSTPRALHAASTSRLHHAARPALKSKEVLVRERLAELFDFCRARDYVQAASYLVYHGAQKRRDWKDTYNYNNREEQPAVEEMCNRIHEMLHGSDGQEYGDVKIERESEGEWVALEVTFRKSGERKKLTFAFLKIKGKYCLGDVD
jgi:hypothetical protein